ncbi:DUF2142 domain-containing protein [Ruegeria conchae]|uniref:Putative membrane protein n=1 Tax=Ruegeria conchae TaxID=981384 RepID=A0A497YRJ7_9RHOB|nr:DUF2142 domain-containing protein [Ruegeria conchae]RLJ98539.1 putative membrane protein [Ruegeria conchae]
MTYDRSLLAVLSVFCAALWIGLLTPPFQSPDEFDHVERAYLLSKGQFLLSTDEGRASGGNVDTGLLDYMAQFKSLPHHPEVKVTSAQLNSAKDIDWSGKRAYETLPGTGYYFPLIYLPQALALACGEFLGQSVDASYKLARLFTLGAGSLILLAAFRIMVPSALVIALLFLPMTLFQAASASIDFISTAMVLLIIALYLDIMKRSTRPSIQRMLGLSALIFLLAGCRLHMAPLVLLPLTFGVRFRSIPAISLFMVLCIAIISWYGFALSITKDMRVDLGATTTQILEYYVLNPWQFADTLWATLSDGQRTLYYLHTFLGILGWLDVPFSPQTYTTLFLIVLLILMFAILQGRIDDGLSSFALISSAFGGFFIVFFSLLVTWTPHPASAILGVQGRYFLLPILFLACLFQSRGTIDGRARKYRMAENVLLILLLSFSLFATSEALEARYYFSSNI